MEKRKERKDGANEERWIGRRGGGGEEDEEGKNRVSYL